mmetsp:Transcript_16874/g.18824  ORF Transcript_16874/g.18824 Transcript_16874/m.18824 type:complete len:412 (+) Transcript_16874:32-1267(+)
MLRTGIQTTFKRAFHASRAVKREAVILSASRTPIGSFNGALASLQGPELGAIAIKDAVAKAGVSVDDVGEAFLGNVVSANVGQAPARQAILKAGLPFSVPCTTVNKVCSSGLKSVMFAAQSVLLGQQNVTIAGGFESMSNIPYYLPRVRQGLGYGHGEVLDGVLKDGLWDASDDHHMGMCAEACAETYNFTREQQDAFALESYRRAAEAAQAGRFDAEIAPVTIKTRKGEVSVTTDEEWSKVKMDKVPGLRPAFTKTGTVTAANASSLNDGAAAFVVADAEWAASKGLKPLARIRGFGDAAKAPIEFTTAPALAVPVALKNAGLAQSDVDLWEINEAFSVVSLANNQLLNLDPSTVNVNGGAVALGHPIGASGARILVTLLHTLQQQDKSVGVAAICNGGGGAAALVVERM